MGFKDFLVVIEAPLRSDAATFVREVLRLPDHVPLATMTYEDLCRNSEYVAVVEHAGKTVIWWPDEVSQIVCNEPSALKDTLCALEPGVAWAALAVYDVSNFYGFALFEAGRRVRCRSGAFEGYYADGEPLPEEEAYFRPSKELGESGNVLYDHDGETWEHHQIGGGFVSGPIACRVLGADLHDGSNGFQEARWSVFGTVAQREEYLASEKEAANVALRNLHDEFGMATLAAQYSIPVSELRKEFAARLQAKVQRLLGEGFELEAVEAADGDIQLFSYFKAVRFVLFANRQIPLRLARTLDPTMKAGEEQGLRLGYRLREKQILPSILAGLETGGLPSGLATLVRCHEDQSLNRTAHAALEEALRTLGARQEGS